jgi:hypothetical protein
MISMARHEVVKALEFLNPLQPSRRTALPASRLLKIPQLETFSLPSTRLEGLKSLQLWHLSSCLMQPLRLVFSFDHLTSALLCLGPSTSLADPRCRRLSYGHASHRRVSYKRLSYERMSQGRASHGRVPHGRVPHGHAPHGHAY